MDREPAGSTYLRTTLTRVHSRGGFEAAIVAAAIGLILLAFAVTSVAERGGTPGDPGWSAKAIGGIYTVSAVSATGRGALEVGDQLIAVAGDREAGSYGPVLALARLHPGDRYSVTVRRQNRVLTVPMEMNPPGPAVWGAFLPTIIVAVLLYTTGAWIGILKAGDRFGRIASANFFLESLVAFADLLTVFPGWSPASAAIAVILIGIWRPWALAVGYDFLSQFPEPLPQSQAERATRRALYACAALLWIPINLPVFFHLARIRPNALVAAMLPLRPDAQPGALIMAVFESAAAVLICAVLVRNYFRLPDPDSRRKMRWAGLSFAAVLVVFIFFAITKTALYVTGSQTAYRLAVTANHLGTFVVGIAPIALAYAVVKHRVLGIHVAVRRGLQYLFARRVLQFIILLPLVIVLFEVIANPGRSVSDLLLRSSWVFYAAVITTAGISLRYRRQMHRWLDRKFFRVAHAQEELLVALIDRIKTSESEEEIALAVARELELALHVDELTILLRSRSGRLRVAYARVPERAARIRDWLNNDRSGTLGSGSVLTLYETEGSPAPDAAPPQTYREILVVPLMGTAANLGALVLGQKRSEEPYTNRDRDLLKAIAAQMAVMYEVLELKERVADQQRVRVQVLGRLDAQRIHLLSECPDCGRCYTSAQRTCAADGATLSLTLPVEQTIDEKYQLIRRIGYGAMGVVYEALDTRLARQVAIKIMVGNLFGNVEAVSRFEREARAAALLDHPNIVKVHDIGRVAAGGAYFVMELIRGRSWRDRLRAPEGVPADRASAWIAQLCSAVATAHAGGIIHRDLKPENIMITEETHLGRAVVLDFGLAKIRAEVSQAEGDLTIVGAVMGTRGYMSPEQQRGAAVDARTDVYSVAVICAETLTGARPPKSGATPEWVAASLAPVAGTGTRLAQVLERATSEQPSHRPATIAEFHLEFSSALAEVTLRRPISRPGEVGAAETMTLPRGTSTQD